MKAVWAVFGPAVGWSFIGTGLYAWRRRPESRIGALMILLGFAWFLFTLQAANSRLVYTIALVAGSLWGAIFLQLGLSFPTGRLTTGLDRTLAIAGYFVFPLAFVPALLFSRPHELGCDDCPTNLLLVRRDADVAAVLTGLGALCYLILFGIVLAWAVRRWRATPPIDRLQLTPVYTFSLLTFLLVTVARAGAGAAAQWPAFISTLLMPFAFLAGLEPALQALASRAPVPVTVEADDEERLPGPVESAAYFVVSEALANVAKYAEATQAAVAVRRTDGRVTVDVTDDGIGGADAARGSGLNGLIDRVAALDGTLALESPAGGGTHLHAEIPCG